MKKTILILAAVFMVNTAFAQECKKVCDKKDSYVMNGDLIEATLYHDNGIIAQTGFYDKDNKLQGEWISYDTAGNKTAVANYEGGKKVGTWSFFQGNEMKQVSYKDSRIAEVRTWEMKDTRVVSN